MIKRKPEMLLFDQIREIVLKSHKLVYQQVNTLKVITNFLIGNIIVENEQDGEQRAQYGKETLKLLSESLTTEFGRGFSVDNLELMRLFYILYQSKFILEASNSETVSRNSDTDAISATMSRISKQQSNLLKLSWSHFVLLMKMNEQERAFYEIEAIANNWSIRELERQYNSSLYERLALSKDKEKIKQLSTKGQLIDLPSDLIKQPYILEFLGLKEESARFRCMSIFSTG